VACVPETGTQLTEIASGRAPGERLFAFERNLGGVSLGNRDPAHRDLVGDDGVDGGSIDLERDLGGVSLGNRDAAHRDLVGDDGSARQ
jgi:hypothetical protein